MSKRVSPSQYDYHLQLISDLDHTADVQCHCWGKTLTEAFANMAPCMFNYMTDLSTVVIDPTKTIKFTVKGTPCINYPYFRFQCNWLHSLYSKLIQICHEGHDMQSLLFAYMDEFLYRFSTDSFCCVEAEILSFDRELFSIDVLA